MKRSCVAVALAFAVAACSELQPTAPESTLTAQFSAPSGFGTTIDIEEVNGVPSINSTSGFDTGFRHAITAQWGDSAAMDRIFRRWLTTLVSARLSTASTDNELFVALSDFDSWLLSVEAIFFEAQTMFAAELDAFDQVAASKLMQAIDGNLTVCRTEQSFGALANVIMWYDHAEVLALPGSPHWTLDNDAIRDVIRDFCLTVEVQSILFPNPVEAGEQFTLHTNTAVRFADQSATVPAAFQMDIAYSPGDFITSFTDELGHFDTPLSFPTAGTAKVIAIACLVLPGRTEATFYACGDRTEFGNVLDPPPPPPPSNCSGTLSGSVAVGTAGAVNALANYEVIDGNLFIANNDSLVNITFPCLRTVTGGLNISNNRAMTGIAFPELLEVGRILSVITNPILTAASFPALQQVGYIGSIPGIPGGALAINNNPALTSIDIGAVTIHRQVPSQLGGLQIMLPHSLTALNGLSSAIAVDTLFFTLPPAGQPGLTRAQFQAYKASAPGVQQVCELPFGAGGARVCL